jgi:hypothetical protein
MDKSISYSDLWLATSNYEEEEEIIWPWDAGDDDWSRPLDTDEDID